MRKKGLVYRATMILGVSIIFVQFGGELVYQKYFKKDREFEMQTEQQVEQRKNKFTEEDQLNEDINADIAKNKIGVLGSWKEARQRRLDKIKQSKERPSAPLLEELKEKPGYKEIKTRKLVQRDPELDNARDAAKDDYI